MQKKLKNLDIVLENCEWFRFLAGEHGVKSIVTGPIYSLLRSYANVTRRESWVKEFSLTLAEGANPSEGLAFRPGGGNYDWASLSERLSQGDITQLEAHYEDGSSELLFVQWSEPNDGLRNPAQISFLQNSDLYIEVKHSYD